MASLRDQRGGPRTGDVNDPGDERLPGLALALAIPAVTLAVLHPPEIAGAGGIIPGLFATAAALLFAWRTPSPGGSTGRAAVVLAPLAVVSLLAAPCRARAFDEAAQAGALVLVGLLGWVAARDARSWRFVPVLLTALASGAAAQAILQAHWLYPREVAIVRAAGAPTADNLILRLEAGRPSGPFILPSSLGVFLAMSLPGTLVLLRRATSRRARVTWAAAALLQLYALALTLSLGGVAAAAGGMLLVLPAILPRRRLAGGALIVFAAIGLAAGFVHLRRAEIGRGPGGDPVVLRAGNWRAAAQMIKDRPLLGVGPGSFGTAYPRYMREGMNETQYAHNSYLQAAACWGLWILGPIGALLAGFLRKVRSLVLAGGGSSREAGARLALAAGVAGFLLHNLVDFTLYLPGIAVPAALLLGMTLGDGAPRPVATPGRRIGWRLAAVMAAVLMAWHVRLEGPAASHMEAARRAAEAGDAAQAAAFARLAAASRPGSSEPWAFLAQLVLAHHMEEDALRREGLEAASRAVSLDPESAILHHTRALYYAAEGERASAYLEERRAHLLYPLKKDYRIIEAEGEAP